MTPSWTVDDVIRRLPAISRTPLPAPEYKGGNGTGVGLAVESMKNHMTDEGWQIFAGLQYAGYRLAGHGLPGNLTDVGLILREMNPGIVVVQDKREWDNGKRDFRDPKAKFNNVRTLSKRPDIFRLTILKDSQQRPDYHSASAVEMGCHAWIVYYNQRIVQHNAPYLRPEHVIRTYHSLDPAIVPRYQPVRPRGALLSGAVSGAYPLRQRLTKDVTALPGCQLMKHPGYHRNGCQTPAFLQELSKYKVAICTSSLYGYALRKIIEATAAGCIVVTDLPSDEVLPAIDGNLVRVRGDASTAEIAALLPQLYDDYDWDKQAKYAAAAKEFYDYRSICCTLARNIETLRSEYVSPGR